MLPICCASNHLSYLMGNAAIEPVRPWDNDNSHLVSFFCYSAPLALSKVKAAWKYSAKTKWTSSWMHFQTSSQSF